MKVLLEVRSGPRTGHRMRLAEQQQLTIGRSEWADFVFSDDRDMPDMGVVLDCSLHGCRATAPDPASPFLVNGQPSIGQSIKNGDILQVGSTEILVSVPTPAAATQTPASLVWTPAGRSSSNAPDRHYSVRRCRSGLTCYSGSAPLFPPAELVALVARRMVLYVLFHAKSLPPDELESASTYPMVPDSVARPDDALTADLRILSPNDGVDRLALTSRLWGKASLVLVLATRELEPFLGHLSSASFLLSRHELVTDRMETGPLPVLTDAFRGVGGVVVADGPMGWRIYSDAQARPTWQSIGLPSSPQPTTSTDNSSSRLLTDSKRFS